METEKIVFTQEEAPYGAPVISTQLAKEVSLLTDLRLMATLLYSVSPTAIHRDTTKGLIDRFSERILNVYPRPDPKED